MQTRNLAIAVTLATATVSNPAAEPPAKAPAPPASSAGLVNDWLRTQSPSWNPWDIGANIQIRGEHRESYAAPGIPGAVDFRDQGGNHGNTFLLMKEKVHLGYKGLSWATAFAEARDSRSWNDERNPDPEADELDLHQAFITLGNPKEFPLTAKIGRQEMNYGEERLIGAFDWNNIGRVFDAAKLRLEGDAGWVDGFVSHVVIPDDHNFNDANEHDYFSGLYASTRTLIPKQETQLYFLARNASTESPTVIGPGLPPILTGASPRDIYTLGLRVQSLPGALGNWDYDADLAGQLGRFKFSSAGDSLDHEAFAAHLAGGYTWKETAFTPRVGLEYNIGSGDNDPSDGKHGTFENLFPTNHKFYGYMDFSAWQNLHNPRLATSIKPLPKLTVTFDWHAFWLVDTDDYYYQVNGAPRNAGGYGINPDAGSYVGTETDLVMTYAIRPYANAQVGYGHFFRGDYIKESLSASGSRDADFVYVQLKLAF